MNHHYKQGITQAMQRIPSGLFVVTARHEDHRAGMLASWVQQVSQNPPMIMIAVEKSRTVMPLISTSGKFGLCQIQEGEQVIVRKFAHQFDPSEDPFLGFEILSHTVTNVPILTNVLGYLECEVSCHIDVEGDHDLFVGLVCAGGYNGGEPLVQTAKTTFTL